MFAVNFIELKRKWLRLFLIVVAQQEEAARRLAEINASESSKRADRDAQEARRLAEMEAAAKYKAELDALEARRAASDANAAAAQKEFARQKEAEAEEARRKAMLAEESRLQAERDAAEARRLMREQEEARMKAESDARRLREEELAARRRAEDELRIARQRVLEEEEARRRAEDLVAKINKPTPAGDSSNTPSTVRFPLLACLPDCNALLWRLIVLSQTKLTNLKDLPPLGLGGKGLGTGTPLTGPLSRREPLSSRDIATHPSIDQLSEEVSRERDQLLVRWCQTFPYGLAFGHWVCVFVACAVCGPV